MLAEQEWHWSTILALAVPHLQDRLTPSTEPAKDMSGFMARLQMQMQKDIKTIYIVEIC